MIEICRHLGDGTTEADLFDHHGSELRAYECGIFFLWDGRHSHEAGPTDGGHINPTCRSSVYDRGRGNGAGPPAAPARSIMDARARRRAFGGDDAAARLRHDNGAR